MSQPESTYFKLHHLEPELLSLCIGGALYFIFAVSASFFSTDVFAGSHMQPTVDESLIDTPVVKLDQIRYLSQVLAQSGDARVVLVGETHDRYDHHLVQLEILKHLYQTSPNIVLGVEWFQQPFQKHLDEYIAGEITEKEMLHRTDYFNRWRYDYRLYRPILQFAHEHKIPIIALNASKELMSALSKTGADDLSPVLKAQLPTSYDRSDKDYEKRLQEMFELHPEYTGKFEDFVRAQLTWDESMAEQAVEYLQQHPDARMLVLAGTGHIEFGSGIPNRIKRRMDVKQISILVSEDYLPVSETIADYLVLSVVQSLEPEGKVGAYLETRSRLVVVEGFSHDSAIKDAGLEKGAILIGVDQEAVETLADFKLAIMDKKPGDTIELHYLKSADEGRKDRQSVEIELR